MHLSYLFKHWPAWFELYSHMVFSRYCHGWHLIVVLHVLTKLLFVDAAVPEVLCEQLHMGMVLCCIMAQASQGWMLLM